MDEELREIEGRLFGALYAINNDPAHLEYRSEITLDVEKSLKLVGSLRARNFFSRLKSLVRNK